MAIFGKLSTWSLAQKTKAKDAMTKGANHPLERTGKQRPALSSVRVCRVCLRARRRESFLQAGEAEREVKRQGVSARWGLKAAWSVWAERRTGSR
jgi:ribosomal protein S14